MLHAANESGEPFTRCAVPRTPHPRPILRRLTFSRVELLGCLRDLAEVGFWKQSNALVRGEKVYETLKSRNSSFTCAKLFWWYNMYAPVDWSVTPRPHYPADGRKVFDVYTHPADLRDPLVADLGPFPFFTTLRSLESGGA